MLALSNYFRSIALPLPFVQDDCRNEDKIQIWGESLVGGRVSQTVGLKHIGCEIKIERFFFKEMWDFAPKWVRIAPNGTNHGLFQLRFLYILVDRYWGFNLLIYGKTDPFLIRIFRTFSSS